jgi:PAS domain S-box-containing protein
MNFTVEPSIDGRAPSARIWLEALPCGGFLLDRDGRIVAVNGEAELILGWSAPELEGRRADELLATTDHTPGASGRVDMLRAHAAPERGQMLVRTADDALRPIEYSCVPVPVEDGIGAIFGFRELAHEQELEKDLRRLAAIADESPTPIVELNRDGNLIYANPAMMVLIERFGFSTDARPRVLPANISKVTEACLASGVETGTIEVSVEGNHYEWKLFPVRGAALLRGYGIDATTRKRALIELSVAKAETEVASEAKSKILSSVSREIHEPLEDIGCAARLLLESALSKEQRDVVKSIKSSCAELATSVQEILTIAALDTRNLAAQSGSFNFRGFMARVLAPFVRRATERGLQLTVAIGNHVPSDIASDASRLEQLLRTVLRKMIDTIDAGEISIEVDRDAIAARNAADEANEAFRLFISIAYNRSAYAFGREKTGTDDAAIPFEQSALETALVLPCRQLAALLGGNVFIENNVGRGGRICFMLPVRSSGSGSERLLTSGDKLALT